MRTARADVMAFARALLPDDAAAPAADTVPATFPMRWMASPEIVRWVADVVNQRAAILVRQDIDLLHPLRVEEDYVLAVEVDLSPDQPGHFIVRGHLRDLANRAVATVTSVLMPVTTAERGAAKS